MCSCQRAAKFAISSSRHAGVRCLVFFLLLRDHHLKHHSSWTLDHCPPRHAGPADGVGFAVCVCCFAPFLLALPARPCRDALFLLLLLLLLFLPFLFHMGTSNGRLYLCSQYAPPAISHSQRASGGQTNKRLLRPGRATSDEPPRASVAEI